MDSYSEVLVEDLIDCNFEDSIGLPHPSWTEQALDLFISILKSVKRDNFSSQRDMLEVIAVKMCDRSYNFSIEQIEKKYNSLKKMYTEKKERNQSVEPELSKLFGERKAKSPVRETEEEPSPKRLKADTFDNSIESPDKSIETPTEDGEEKKALWTTESTKYFLDLLEELRPQLGSKLKLRTKKQMWEEICRRLRTHGHIYTYPQVENKWKALLRHYRGKLELKRNGCSSIFATLAPKYSPWPEYFGSRSQTTKGQVSDISFANDQKLPYEDDGYTDEDPCEFEETCDLPDVEIVSDEINPVLIEDVKPTNQQLKVNPSTSIELLNPLEDHSPQLEKIFNEIGSFREENRKQQSELLQLKKIELKLYRERTVQFTRIADGFGELMDYLKQKSSDESL